MQAKQYGSAPSGAHPREMSAIILGLSGTSVGSGVKIKSSQVIPSCIQNDTWYTGLVVSLSPGGQHAATRFSAG